MYTNQTNKEIQVIVEVMVHSRFQYFQSQNMQFGTIEMIRFNLSFSATSAIMCYECNSQYDPRCGDNFDPFSLALVNCSLKEPPNHLRDLQPELCRKITQKSKSNVNLW